MKAGDVIATKSNKAIKFFTVGGWSHVGIALNEREVLEATTDGINPIEIEEILKRDGELLVLERPIPLTQDQLEVLVTKGKELIAKNIEYGYLRALYSGAPRVLKNIFALLSFVTLLLSGIAYFISGNIESSYPLLLLAVICNFIGFPLAKSVGAVRETNKILNRFNAPKFLMTDLDKMFCSQVVSDLDREIGGNISLFFGKGHELRPKDIVNSCQALGWQPKNITNT